MDIYGCLVSAITGLDTSKEACVPVEYDYCSVIVGKRVYLMVRRFQSICNDKRLGINKKQGGMDKGSKT